MKHTIIHRSAVVAIVIFLLGGSFAITLERAALNKSISTDTIRPSWETNHCIEREQSSHIHPRDRGYFYAYMACPNGTQGFVTFSLGGGYQWLGEEPAWMTGSDFDVPGNWYAVSYGGGLYQVDPNTGDVTFIATTIPLNSLVYDTTTEIWYACGTDSQGIDSLFTIDVDTGVTTFIGHFGAPNIMISLMCDTEGNMYSYDVLFGGDSHLYSVDKETGEATVIGDMGHDYCYVQEGKFDRNDGTLYLAAYDVGQMQSYLATCDPATGEVTILNIFPPGVEVDALTILYTPPEHYLIADFNWTPPDPVPGETILFNASSSYASGANITLYEWDWNNDGVYEENSTTPTITHTWSNPGEYDVVLRVTDNEGLAVRKTKMVTVSYPDTTPPVTTVTFSGTVGNEGWYIDPVLVSLTAVDNESGVNYTMYDLDNGTWTMYTAPFGVSAEGIHTLRFYSVDNAGNSEEVKSVPLKIDLFPPDTTFSLSGEFGLNNWYVSNVTLVLTVNDTGSGVNHTYYSLGGNRTEYIKPVNLSDGVYQLYFYSVDHAGNTEMPKGPFSFKIDQTPPTVNLTAIPLNLLKTRWRLIINASDEGSGVASIEIYINGVLVGNITFPPWDFIYDGTGKTVQVIAYDNAGNAGKSNVVQDLGLFVDNQPIQYPNGMLSVQQRNLQQR